MKTIIDTLRATELSLDAKLEAIETTDPVKANHLKALALRLEAVTDDLVAVAI